MMNVPTVSPEDLKVFHDQHFSSTSHVGDSAEADEGLGHYADGTERTLTEEQVAMFRHSEIHKLLQERRRRREASTSSESEADPGHAAERSVQSGSKPVKSGRPEGQVTEHGQKKRNQARQKRSFEQMEKNVRAMPVTPEDPYTARRFARELDEVKKTEVELDYG